MVNVTLFLVSEKNFHCVVVQLACYKISLAWSALGKNPVRPICIWHATKKYIFSYFWCNRQFNEYENMQILIKN